MEVVGPPLRVRSIGRDKNGWRCLPLRDAPDNVNGAARLISLENENARALRVFRVVFKELCPLHTNDNLPKQQRLP
jgi:hypothetical protein